MDHNALSIKTYMAIMAERDNAIRERNIALEERKRAFAERDMAMLQRDAAIEERDSAIKERDKAIAALRSVNSTFSDLAGEVVADGAEDMRYQEMCYSMADTEFDVDTINIAEVPTETAKRMKMRHEAINITEVASETAKRRNVRQPKEGHNLKSEEELEKEDAGHDLKSEELEKQLDMQKDNLGLDQINFDESYMPGPVCSCTGTPQPCYKWGNGGWQSACCTMTISRYPLPQVSNKRYTRLGGRKMSGSAFSKLLNRLAAEGHDLYSAPLDLKDHWAKHGSNRYSTLK